MRYLRKNIPKNIIQIIISKDRYLVHFVEFQVNRTIHKLNWFQVHFPEERVGFILILAKIRFSKVDWLQFRFLKEKVVVILI